MGLSNCGAQRLSKFLIVYEFSKNFNYFHFQIEAEYELSHRVWNEKSVLAHALGCDGWSFFPAKVLSKRVIIFHFFWTTSSVAYCFDPSLLAWAWGRLMAPPTPSLRSREVEPICNTVRMKGTVCARLVATSLYSH